jgi:hypothetical protein
VRPRARIRSNPEIVPLARYSKQQMLKSKSQGAIASQTQLQVQCNYPDIQVGTETQTIHPSIHTQPKESTHQPAFSDHDTSAMSSFARRPSARPFRSDQPAMQNTLAPIDKPETFDPPSNPLLIIVQMRPRSRPVPPRTVLNHPAILPSPVQTGNSQPQSFAWTS